MLKLLTGYDQRAPWRLKPALYNRQPAVTLEMEYEIAPGKVGLSARALLASCAHSRHATHWLQSRLRAQDSSEMLLLAYVFSYTPPFSSSGPYLYRQRMQLVCSIQRQANGTNSFVPDFERSTRF